jgi:5-methylcytosine-specific restriction endonuclease McrA
MKDQAYGPLRVVPDDAPRRPSSPVRRDLKGKAWQYVRGVVLRRDNWTCTYCGCSPAARCERHRRPGARPVRLVVDHLLTPERGGHPYDLANLTTACQPCNTAKRDRTPAEWQAEKDRRKAYQRGERPTIAATPPLTGDYTRKPDR